MRKGQIAFAKDMEALSVPWTQISIATHVRIHPLSTRPFLTKHVWPVLFPTPPIICPYSCHAASSSFPLSRFAWILFLLPNSIHLSFSFFFNQSFSFYWKKTRLTVLILSSTWKRMDSVSITIIIILLLFYLHLPSLIRLDSFFLIYQS